MATPFQRRPEVVEDEAMSAREFCDDDAGYLSWLAAHPDGYVINIARSQAHSATKRVCSMPVARRSAVRSHSAAGPDST